MVFWRGPLFGEGKSYRKPSRGSFTDRHPKPSELRLVTARISLSLHIHTHTANKANYFKSEKQTKSAAVSHQMWSCMLRVTKQARKGVPRLPHVAPREEQLRCVPGERPRNRKKEKRKQRYRAATLMQALARGMLARKAYVPQHCHPAQPFQHDRLSIPHDQAVGLEQVHGQIFKIPYLLNLSFRGKCVASTKWPHIRRCLLLPYTYEPKCK